MSDKKELCFMISTTATLVHKKGFCCISVQQCSTNFLVSVDSNIVPVPGSLRHLSSTLTEQTNSEDVSLSMSERACQDVGVVICD